MNSSVQKRIYRTVLEVLGAAAMDRDALIEKTVERLYGFTLPKEAQVGEFTEVRGLVGSVISQMCDDGVLLLDKGRLSAGSQTPLAMKMSDCERSILSELGRTPRTKVQLRSYLSKLYGVDKTATDKDDRMLFNMIGQVLKRLTGEGSITLFDGKYMLSDRASAAKDDIDKLLELKGAFISRVHRGGGEFFEHYIMTLLTKYHEKHGKRVIEARVLGGSSDGGIDGVMRTIDALGFKETIMVQAKNRTDLSTETTVRGFYGAVCASGGSRGIFACMSDFHPSAKLFLAGIDNCVGLTGDDIFKMACECRYGIRVRGGKMEIDRKVL